MKKFLSLLMAVMMVLGCVSAVAEDTSAACLTAPYTADFSLNFDETLLFSLIGMDVTEEDKALMEIISPLLKNLGGRVIATEEGTEIALTLKSAPIVTLGVYQDENSVKLLSDLFPNYAIQMPVEKTSPALDDEALVSLITPHLTNLQEKVTGKITAVENGAFDHDGFIFDTKTVIEMNAQDCVNLFTDAASSLLSDEALMGILQSAMEITSVDTMLAELEEMKNTDFSNEEGGILACIYSAENNDHVFITAECEFEDTYIAMDYLSTDEKASLVLLGGDNVFLSPEQMKTAALSGSDEAILVETTFIPGEKAADFEVQVDLHAGMYAGINLKSALLPLVGQAVNLDISMFPGVDPIISLTGLILNGGQLTLPALLAPTTVIELDPALLETEEGAASFETLAYELGADISSFGLNTLLANAAAAMPVEVSALITYLMAPPEDNSTAPVFDGVNN